MTAAMSQTKERKELSGNDLVLYIFFKQWIQQFEDRPGLNLSTFSIRNRTKLMAFPSLANPNVLLLSFVFDLPH